MRCCSVKHSRGSSSSCAPEHLEEIMNVALPLTVLGTTGGGGELKIKTSRGQLAWDVNALRDVWWNAIGRLMDT